jgi:methyl-accepting chemotaxis protein
MKKDMVAVHDHADNNAKGADETQEIAETVHVIATELRDRMSRFVVNS